MISTGFAPATRIAPVQTPELRVCAKVPLHVFVNCHLEIDADAPEGTDDHVCAHSSVDRYIATGIR
jgi:hypothetical protein